MGINFQQLSVIAGEYISSGRIDFELLPTLDDIASQLEIQAPVLEALVRSLERMELTCDMYRYFMSSHQIPRIFKQGDQSLDAIKAVYCVDGYAEIEINAIGSDLTGEEIARSGTRIAIAEIDYDLVGKLGELLIRIFPDRYVAIYNKKVIAAAETLDIIHNLIPLGPPYMILNTNEGVQYPVLLHTSPSNSS